MKTIGFFVTGIFILFLLIGATIGFRWLGLEVDAWLLPKQKEIETNVYRNSKSFVDGTIRELRKLQTEYLTSENEDHKAALKSRILHAADELDPKWLATKPDLQNFVNSLRTSWR